MSDKPEESVAPALAFAQSPLQRLLERIRKHALSEIEKGQAFEKLCRLCLQTEPRYATLYHAAWRRWRFVAKIVIKFRKGYAID